MNRFGCHRFILSLLSLMLTSNLGLNAKTAAEKLSTPHEPPPELERLNMVGTWDTTALYRYTPDGPIFKGHNVDTVRWSPNKQFLISDQQGLTPEGWKNKLVITTWNPAEQEYKLIDLNPAGEIVELAMTIDNGVRKLVYYPRINNRPVRAELTIRFTSADEYKYRCVFTDQERNWVYCEGTAKKRK